MNENKEKYGLLLGITMVVGIVIGSGIFFKTEEVLEAANDNILAGLIAFIIGGIAVIFGATVFGMVASRSKQKGGLSGYLEEAYGKRASYCIGVFQATIFLPILAAALAWASSRFFIMFLGINIDPYNSSLTWIIAIFLLINFYVFNYFKPMLASKFHVPITFVPFIPLLFVGIVGTISGAINGTLQTNFYNASNYFSNITGGDMFMLIFASTVVTSFAYEGWIVATNIEGELKNSKKNLPLALLIGSIVIVAIYVLFYIGMVSYLPVEQMDDNPIMTVVVNILGNPIWGTIMIFFVFISCIGTLNGLALGGIRAPHLVASNNCGIMPNKLKEVNKDGLSFNSAIYSFICSIIMLLILFIGANEGFSFLYPLIGVKNINIITGAIVILNISYIMIYLNVIVKYKSLSIFKRFVLPILATMGSLVLLIGGIVVLEILIGIIVCIIFLLISQIWFKKNN